MARVSSQAAEQIGNNIRKHREPLGWNSDRLALNCDVDTRNMRAYEAGDSPPNLFTLVRIAKALGIPPGALLEGVEPEMFPDHKNRKGK